MTLFHPLFLSLTASLCLVAGCADKPAAVSAVPPRAVQPADKASPVDAPRPEASQSDPLTFTIPETVAEPESDPEVADDPKPETKPFRPADQRPVHDDEQLAAVGIQRFESKRLRLYTDIDADVAEQLPPIVDQLYDALTAYFGPLPPDEAGRDFQMTGYLIRDEVIFRKQGLMNELPHLLHGKHVENRFWMRDQPEAYFRRHLLLHECTHCFMTFLPGEFPPLWYMEGMAELFATHRLDDQGRAEFRILPRASDQMDGWGRIAGIRRECQEGRSLTLPGVQALTHNDFFRPLPYAWSWSLCQFLDSHPHYQSRFRKLGQHLSDGKFPKEYRKAFAADWRNHSTEWTLFEHQLQTGYDTQRAAIDFVPEQSLDEGESWKGTIQAARGWQDLGLRVAAGEVWNVTATGQFTLAQEPKPWVSEPQGISFQYFEGQKLGRLLACLDADPTRDTAGKAGTHLVQIVPVGRSARLTIPAPGRLLFRVNDAWDELADNEGAVEITVERLPGKISP